MSKVISLLVSPFLVLLSIFLACFAAMTTIFAFSTLFIRVIFVYADLAAALVQNQFTTKIPSSRFPVAAQAHAMDRNITHHERKGRRSSTASGSSNGGGTTPRAFDASRVGTYSNDLHTRDFEGVGGWRASGPGNEDLLWTNMNSRLELPTSADGLQRNHHRSKTSSSMTAMPMLPISPTDWRTRIPTRNHVGQLSSPEEYFADQRPSRSTASLDTANIGRTLRRKQSSSSGSSQSSARTLPIATSNG